MAKFGPLIPMLQAPDLTRTIAFYRDVLGFRIDSAWPSESPVWCQLSRDQAQVMFMTNDHYGGPAMTGTLYIQVDDAQALHHQLKGQVPVLWGPEAYPYGMLEFAIQDCNGYTISFGQPIGEESPA